MNYHNFNIYLVFIFLLATLLIGLLASRGVKDIRDYAVANKSFGVGAIAMTYLATIIGGGDLFGESQSIFKLGVCSIIGILGMIVAQLIRAKFIVRKLLYFKDCFTVSNIMGELYGEKVKIFTGIVSVIHSSIFAGLQISCLGFVFEKFLGVDAAVGIVIGGAVMALYSTFGGIRAVTATDILQLILMIGTLSTVSFLTVRMVGGTASLFNQLPLEKFSILNNELLPMYISVFLLDAIFSAEMFEPATMQRMLMAKTPIQLRKVFYIVAPGYLAAFCMIMIIFLSASVLYPNIDSVNVVPHVFNGVLPDALKGMAIVGLISILMSSGDSHLNSSGIIMSVDVLSPLIKKLGFQINVLNWAKISTLIGGVFAISFALWGKNMFRLDLLVGASAPIMAAPLLIGILGLKPERKAFWISSISGLVSLVIADIFLSEKYNCFSILIATVFSTLVFLFANYFFNNKLEFRKFDSINSDSNHNLTFRFYKINDYVIKMLDPIFNFRSWCQEKVSQYGASYELFGIFYLFALLVPYYIWPNVAASNENLMIYLRVIAIALCSLIITSSIWSTRFSSYLPAFWYVVLTYCLPFMSTMMLLLTNGSNEYTINIAITIMFLIVLVDWISAIGIGVIGTLLAIYIYINFIEDHANPLVFSFNASYSLIYQIVFGTIIGFLFIRRKQIKTQELKRGKKSATELYELATERLNYNELVSLRISKSLGDLNMDIMKKMNNVREAIEHGDSDIAEEYLDILESDIVNVVVTEENCLKLHVEEIDLKDLSSDLERLFKDNFGYDIFVNLRSKASRMKCDKMALYRIISQAMNDLKIDLSLDGRNMNETPILIDISDTHFKYSLSTLKEYSKVISAIRFVISTIDSIDLSLLKNEYQKQLVDAFKLLPSNDKTSEKIITDNYLEAHYGLFEQTKLGQDIMKIYVLPQDVHEIRPIGLDIYAPEEDVLSYWPEAIDRELKFKNDLSVKAPDIIWENIQKALNFIRRYHAHQIRNSGEPYYLHPIAVSRILLNMISKISSKNDEVDFALENSAGKDILKKINTRLSKTCKVIKQDQEDAIIAALLHDILENTATNPLSIESIFGSKVANYVLAVAKITCNEILEGGIEEKKIEELFNQEGVIPISIKLADRLHSIYTIDSNPDEKQRYEMAKETLVFFIEPAKNLGFDEIAEDLESASNHILKHGKLDGFEFKADVMEFLKF